MSSIPSLHHQIRVSTQDQSEKGRIYTRIQTLISFNSGFKINPDRLNETNSHQFWILKWWALLSFDARKLQEGDSLSIIDRLNNFDEEQLIDELLASRQSQLM
jgi:hypothetical protein